MHRLLLGVPGAGHPRDYERSLYPLARANALGGVVRQRPERAFRYASGGGRAGDLRRFSMRIPIDSVRPTGMGWTT